MQYYHTNFVDIKGEHWCKTIFHRVKGQTKRNHFAKKLFQKSFSLSTFKPHKVENKIFFYSLLLLYPAGGNTLFLLQPAGGNSSLLLYPACGNSLVLLLLAGRKQRFLLQGEVRPNCFPASESKTKLFPPAG